MPLDRTRLPCTLGAGCYFGSLTFCGGRDYYAFSRRTGHTGLTLGGCDFVATGCHPATADYSACGIRP